MNGKRARQLRRACGGVEIVKQYKTVPVLLTNGKQRKTKVLVESGHTVERKVYKGIRCTSAGRSIYKDMKKTYNRRGK